MHCHDATARSGLKRTQMALLPWPSQARGVYAPGRAGPDERSDESMVQSWYSDANFVRQIRANELAERYGVDPVAIALAWVLCQPFPTFPLIGPRTVSETRSSVAALDVQLTPGEMKYLNLED